MSKKPSCDSRNFKVFMLVSLLLDMTKLVRVKLQSPSDTQNYAQWLQTISSTFQICSDARSFENTDIMLIELLTQYSLLLSILNVQIVCLLPTSQE
jgi:hypothetical protein